MKFAIVLLALACCAPAGAQQRLERETPAGRVPPPSAAQRGADGLPGETAMMAQPKSEAAVDPAEVVRRFATTYTAQESPRMVVYFNRELSADVREWVSSERIAVEAESRERRSGAEGESRTDRRGAAAVSRQYATPDGGRVGPGERWMWEFEQAVSDMLLDARVHLVDRALAMRRQGAQSETVAGNPASARTLEMEALASHADLLVEIWVARSDDSPIGYEFRAQVKEVATGRLVTMVTTWGEGLPTAGPRPVVATSRGYDFVDEVPTVADAAQALGVELMESLTRRWGR